MSDGKRVHTPTRDWRGVTVDERTADMLDEVARLTDPLPLIATSGSYENWPTQGGTHLGGGAVNLSLTAMPPADVLRLVRALRQVGFAAWARRVEDTGGAPYVQAIAVDCPDLSPQARMQVRAYETGLNGLPNNRPDDGPREFVGVTWESYTPEAAS